MNKRLMIFIPASRDWMEEKFMFEFLRLIDPPGWTKGVTNLRGHCASDRHNEAFNSLPRLEAMWETRFDRIFFMDSDQYYPGDFLVKMVAHEEPVVAAWSVSRYPPYEIAQYNNAGDKIVDGVTFPDYQTINQNDFPDDTFECDAVGLGAAMFDRDLIDKIDPVWFTDLNAYDGTRLLCDDFHFFSKLNKSGYRVTVDKRIPIGHYSNALVLPSNRHLLKEAAEIAKEYTG